MTDINQPTAGLLAGAAQVDITPAMGTQIAGDIGRRRPAEILLDPIYARALVLESGATRLCVLSLDLLAADYKSVAAIRRLATERFGLVPEAVMVHTVQNHAAPSLGHHLVTDECDLIPPEMEWFRGGDPAYDVFAIERIVDAVGQAIESLEPVSVGVARGMDDRVAFNRRFIMRNGTTKTHPGADVRHEILCREGPMDPEVGVACFTAEPLRNVAMLLHHTCHPVHGYPKRYISAGWPGAWSQQMAAAHGPQSVPLVINGCCGNIHHANHLDPHQLDDPIRMGECLTETAGEVLQRLSYGDGLPLDRKSTSISLPIRELTPEQLDEAGKLLAEHPEPIYKDAERTAVDWRWFYAVSALDVHELRRRQPEYPYEIQAFRIGDIALLALGGEPFVEAQLHIKAESRAPFTFIAHMSNGFVGYIPTAAALSRGGYEAHTSAGSCLVPEALDMVADASVQLLNELFSE